MSARFATFAGALLVAGCSSGERPAAGCGAAPACTGAAPWRTVATPADRERLRRWRDAWNEALPQVREAEAPALTTLGALGEPDLALTDPLPPAGAYQCRVVKLGARSPATRAFAAHPPVGCRVDADGSFVMLTGAQRPGGRLYPSTDTRGVFLGTLSLGDEASALTYGTDAQRDLAGFVERIGEHRWRLVLPYPAFESLVDVVELVPASATVPSS